MKQLGLKLTIHLHTVQRLKCVELYPTPPHIFMAWCLIKHTDMCTITFNTLISTKKNSYIVRLLGLLPYNVCPCLNTALYGLLSRTEIKWFTFTLDVDISFKLRQLYSTGSELPVPTDRRAELAQSRCEFGGEQKDHHWPSRGPSASDYSLYWLRYLGIQYSFIIGLLMYLSISLFVQFNFCHEALP
jgi:hypothetical protein